jgi:hypothetical protein
LRNLLAQQVRDGLHATTHDRPFPLKAPAPSDELRTTRCISFFQHAPPYLGIFCVPCQVYLADLILLHGTEAAALTNKAAASAGASASASPLPLEADLARAAPGRARVQVLGAVDGPSAEAPFATVLLRRLLEPGDARAEHAAENAAGRGPTAGVPEPRGVGGFGGGRGGGFGGGVSSGLLSSSLAAHDSR